MSDYEFTLEQGVDSRPTWIEAHKIGEALRHEGEVVVTVRLASEVMTHPQRKRLNAMCGDLSKQVRLDWETGLYVNAKKTKGGRKLAKDEWRHIFVAVALGQTSVPNPEGGGFIVLGQSSSHLSIKTCTECMMIITAFGDAREVEWSDPNEQSFRRSIENSPEFYRRDPSAITHQE